MASYRFCRSDDVAALGEAHDTCWLPHAPDEPPLTIERFRKLARELDLWTSSCMLAREDRTPIGVLLATKRERETLVWRIAMRPGFERRGHGRHMLTSLSQKLAILGPPRIVAEVPEANAGACAFFDACGFRREGRFVDFVLRRRPAAATVGTEQLVVPVSLEDVMAHEPLEAPARRPWARSPATLQALGPRVTGEAIASAERLEAWLLFDDEEAEAGPLRRILGLGAIEPTRGALWLDLLLRRAVSTAAGSVVLERATEAEARSVDLGAVGFEPAAVTIGFAAEPRPA
jgi:RimJ/RimL family protein N-acetyltransferase